MTKSCMEKQVKTKDDGRYIIFYSFPKKIKKEEQNVGTKMESAAQNLGDCCHP